MQKRWVEPQSDEVSESDDEPVARVPLKRKPANSAVGGNRFVETEGKGKVNWFLCGIFVAKIIGWCN